MHDKFALCCGPLHNIDDDTKPVLCKFDKPALVALIHENSMQARETPLGFMKDILCAITIGDRGGTHDDKQDETKRIGHEMPLATFHLLRWVEPFLTTHFSRWHALTVDNSNTWFTLSTGLGAHIATEERVDVLPGSVIAPLSILVPDVIPGGKIAR